MIQINQQTATDLLRRMLGENASFRPGQYEAIESVINFRGKQLLVQKTGWGKSIIYFILTKILRDAGKGPTLLISPLLSLMRNQIYHASKIGIRAESINSTNYNEWNEVINHIANNEVDIFLVSPERLSNQKFLQEILPIMKGIGMLVVDEVHCISDWGHDFRPDYRRIRNLIQETFDDIPILGTTATANDRVIKDVEEQFGENVATLRGPLARSGLKFQNIVLGSMAERLAWLSENIPKIEGSGIVYCLTRKDAYRLSEWLKHVGIDSCHHYWGGTIPDEEGNDLSPQLEQDLIDNDIKVLIATSALGMGFDKPDLSFVIHYQSPGSAVAYYQQVGRAGRAVDESYGILLHGNEDNEILDYFLNEALPTEEESNAIIQYLESVNEARLGDIKKNLNLKDGRIAKAIKHLEIDGFIAKDNYKYSRTPRSWVYDKERVEKLKEIRLGERQKIADYISYDGCLMNFITNELDDPESQECGICSNCSDWEFPETTSKELIFEALKFLSQDYQLIEPRKRWPAGIFDSTIIPSEQHIEQGRSMCLLEDAGWGNEIKKCFKNNIPVSDDFLDAAVHLINEDWNPDPFPDIITFIPGKNNDILNNFCKRLSEALDIDYEKTAGAGATPGFIIIEKEKPAMIEMKNSHHKVLNGVDKWSVCSPFDNGGDSIYNLNDEPSGNNKGTIMLIDDYVDSKWTFTILGAMLRKFGFTVYPFSLGMVKK